jgi:hypothetical protein
MCAGPFALTYCTNGCWEIASTWSNRCYKTYVVAHIQHNTAHNTHLQTRRQELFCIRHKKDRLGVIHLTLKRYRACKETEVLFSGRHSTQLMMTIKPHHSVARLLLRHTRRNAPLRARWSIQ